MGRFKQLQDQLGDVFLHPREMSDEDLDQATATYRLLRIRPIRKEASDDGPGSLAWIWAIAGIVLLLAIVSAAVIRKHPG